MCSKCGGQQKIKIKLKLINFKFKVSEVRWVMLVKRIFLFIYEWSQRREKHDDDKSFLYKKMIAFGSAFDLKTFSCLKYGPNAIILHSPRVVVLLVIFFVDSSKHITLQVHNLQNYRTLFTSSLTWVTSFMHLNRFFL